MAGLSGEKNFPGKIDISDKDVFEAMKDMPGYLDITPGDFKELYKYAYNHALSRITRSIKARDIMTRDVISVDKMSHLRGSQS